MFWIKYLLIAGVMHLAENKALSLPYAPDSQGRCSDRATYLDRKVKHCCSLCAPGFHARNACTPTSDTVCEQCKEGTYLEAFNHAKNCFKCKQCREDRGLIYTRICSTSSDALCACAVGTYCVLRERDLCTECTALSTCPPGEGVSRQGTADSDVNCSPCHDGTFSDKTSYSDTCQLHTDCEAQGRKTLRSGSSTSDAVCGPMMKSVKPGIPTTTTTSSPAPSTTRTQATSSYFTNTDPHTNPAQDPPHKSQTTQHKESVTFIVVVMVPFALLLGVIVPLAVCLSRKRKGDANNNIKKEAHKPLHGALVLGQHESFHSHPPEQQCLLGEKDSSNPSLSSSSTSSTDHRSPVDPGPAVPSCGSVIHSSQEGSVCHDSLQAGNPAVTVQISATISCHLPPGTHLCPVPTGPVKDTTTSNPDLPLSKEEEEWQGPAKEAHPAVQESGKVVC